MANTELGESKGAILLDAISVVLDVPETGPWYIKRELHILVAETNKLTGHFHRLEIWT